MVDEGEPSMIPPRPMPSILISPDSGLSGGDEPWLWPSGPSLVLPLLRSLQLELLQQVLV